MDLRLGKEYTAFRQQAADFVAQNWSPDDAGDRAKEVAFRRDAARAGLMYLSFPRAYGGAGTGADPIKDAIVRQEFAKAGAPYLPNGIGHKMLVPTLLVRGTEAQKEAFVARALSGEDIWCQGYSEPGAGSDLASLSTRAVRDGDHWIINGSKIWTSNALDADMMFILVRTDPDAPKHQGISYLLLDMKAPGITVRPLRQMTGETGFAEVFFDNVATPLDWIVGEPGEGWAVSRTTLGFERTSIAAPSMMFDMLRLVRDRARSTMRNGKPLIDDPAIRDMIAVAEGYATAQTYSVARLVSMDRAGLNPGLAALTNKLHATKTGLKIAEVAEAVLAGEGLIAPEDGMTRHTMDERFWVLRSLGITIAGGASNIQRNIIAERGLGLPREGAV